MERGEKKVNRGIELDLVMCVYGHVLVFEFGVYGECVCG